MSTAPAAPPAPPGTLTATEQAVFTKIAWRVMPILTTAYVLNYLDRTNVGYAALTMRDAIGLSQTQLGVGAAIFFVGYCFLEVPSNMALYKFGARVWLSRILISWGVVSAAAAFAVGLKSFYVLRLLLGAAEAGFFPGVAYYLATWFPREFRTRITAWFMVAIPISSVIGGPLSSVLLALDGTWGLAGWQWLFLVEGLPTVVVGLMLFAQLTEKPEDATWLTDDERRLVRERLASETKPKEVRHFSHAIRDARVLILGAIQFGFLVGSYGIGFFLPQILQKGGLDQMQNGLVNGACYAVASVTMLVWAVFVERHGNRVGNLAAACAVAAVGFAGSVVFADHLWMSVLAITVAVSGVNAARALFWTIPPRFLSGLAAAGGLAFINSIGTAGGFVGPTVMGWLTDYTGSFEAGQLALSGFLLAAALLAWWLRSFDAE